MTEHPEASWKVYQKLNNQRQDPLTKVLLYLLVSLASLNTGLGELQEIDRKNQRAELELRTMSSSFWDIENPHGRIQRLIPDGHGRLEKVVITDLYGRNPLIIKAEHPDFSNYSWNYHLRLKEEKEKISDHWSPGFALR